MLISFMTWIYCDTQTDYWNNTDTVHGFSENRQIYSCQIKLKKSYSYGLFGVEPSM